MINNLPRCVLRRGCRASRLNDASSTFLASYVQLFVICLCFCALLLLDCSPLRVLFAAQSSKYHTPQSCAVSGGSGAGRVGEPERERERSARFGTSAACDCAASAAAYFAKVSHAVRPLLRRFPVASLHLLFTFAFSSMSFLFDFWSSVPGRERTLPHWRRRRLRLLPCFYLISYVFFEVFAVFFL